MTEQRTNAAQPAAAGVSDVIVGRLPTMNQDPYPSLGDWWVQLWDGSGDDAKVIARAYGSTPQEAHERASMIARAILALRPQAESDARRAAQEQLYTERERPQAVPMTDAQVNRILIALPMGDGFWLSFARAIEAHHGITSQGAQGGER